VSVRVCTPYDVESAFFRHGEVCESANVGVSTVAAKKNLPESHSSRRTIAGTITGIFVDTQGD